MLIRVQRDPFPEIFPINISYEIWWNDFVPNNASTNYFVWDDVVVDIVIHSTSRIKQKVRNEKMNQLMISQSQTPHKQGKTTCWNTWIATPSSAIDRPEFKSTYTRDRCILSNSPTAHHEPLIKNILIFTLRMKVCCLNTSTSFSTVWYRMGTAGLVFSLHKWYNSNKQQKGLILVEGYP